MINTYSNIEALWQTHAKQGMIARYEAVFREYGYHLQSLFIPKGRQRLHFRIFTEIGIKNGDSVLDVGCGFGHLYEFLEREQIQTTYTGIDIMESYIAIARNTYPSGDFRVMDILQDQITEQWDYIGVLGTFNVIPEGVERRAQWQFIQAMLTKMLQLSRKGIFADFLSTYVDFQHEIAFHADPCEVFRFCKTLNSRVVIRHDYMPYEFAVYIYKDDTIILEDNVYKDFESYVDWYPQE